MSSLALLHYSPHGYPEVIILTEDITGPQTHRSLLRRHLLPAQGPITQEAPRSRYCWPRMGKWHLVTVCPCEPHGDPLEECKPSDAVSGD